jgi:NAD+ kinase
MSSTPGSNKQSREPVRRAAVITHGKVETIGPALERLAGVAGAAGVELVFPEEEREKHGMPGDGGDATEVDLAVVLGGDGTMLRALQRFLGTSVPVIGVNFGRVGFLASIAADELESGVARVFGGDFDVVDLPTLEAATKAGSWTAVNDVVVRSASVGRMVELGWSVGDEDLGTRPSDGVICSTPVGSTAYNLSNGGPVLVWGLDAMAMTFVAPHALDARPLVIPRDRPLTVVNRTIDVGVTVIVDGHQVCELDAHGEGVRIGLGPRQSHLATLPEVTFFRRYGRTFGA